MQDIHTPENGQGASLSRRNFISIVAAGSAATLPSVAIAGADAKTSRLPQLEELPVNRVSRLADELSHALKDFSGGQYHAEIYPSGQREFPIALKVTEFELPLEKQMEICVANLRNILIRMHPDCGRVWHELRVGTGSDHFLFSLRGMTHRGEVEL
jgi:hypothetical protein